MHLTSKIACHVHSVECVSKSKPILKIIFHAIYGAVCIQLTRFSHDDCENTYTLSSYHHSEVWPISNCLGLGHETSLYALYILLYS